MDKKDIIIVFPSEIHSFAYCPRQYFFSLYQPVKPSFRTRIKLLIGRLYHYIKGYISRKRGYHTEERIERLIGSVLLRGRPDAFRRINGTVEVVERKSGSGPRRGVWISDALQVSAYGVMLSSGVDDVVLKVEYRSGVRVSRLDSDKVAFLLRIIDDIILVKKYGIVPYANRSPARCSRCPYKEICKELDRELRAENLFEPGAIVSGKNVDESFTTETG